MRPLGEAKLTRFRMNRYFAYGLRIRSAFTLPELPTVSFPTADADVEFRRDTVDAVPRTDDRSGSRRIAATPGTCRLTYDSIGSFLVGSGERIVCDPLSTDVMERETFRRLLENELLGLLLHQRDHLVLHASAVSVGGRAAIFLGPRGAGKSTTAAAFQARGYPVLKDDIVAIGFDDGVPTVVPGVPQLRLRPDAAEALDLTEASTPSAESWYEKRYLRVDDVPDSAPLACCYVLRPGDDLRLEEVSGPKKMLELISRTQARGLLDDTGRSPLHFDQCSRVVETVPFQFLHRPDDHELLPSIVQMVVDDIGSTVDA